MPIRRQQRDAGIGGHAELADRGVVADERVASDVGNDEGLADDDGVAAEREFERCLACCREGLGRAGGAHVELALVVHEGDGWRAAPEQLAGETRQTVERLLAGRIEQRGLPQPADVAGLTMLAADSGTCTTLVDTST